MIRESRRGPEPGLLSFTGRFLPNGTARAAPGLSTSVSCTPRFQLSAEGTGLLNEFLITHGQGRPQSSLWDSLNSQSVVLRSGLQRETSLRDS